MAEYTNKESILDKIGSLPLNWKYGQAVDDIYKMVEAEPTVQIGCCGKCKHYFGNIPGNPNVICINMKPDDFCSYFESKDEQ